MNWKRIGRAAICLLVVCCLIFNLSPIKAHAVALESGLLLGMVAAAILTVSGAVFVPTCADDLIALGEHMRLSLFNWGTSAEKLDEVDEFFSEISAMYFGSGSDDDDLPRKTSVKLAQGILAGITAWVATVLLDGATRNVAERAQGNYPSHYPALPDWDFSTYPYFFVIERSPPGGAAGYYLIYSDSPVSYLGDIDGSWYYSPRPVSEYPEYTYSYLYYDSLNASWEFSKKDAFVANSEDLSTSMFSENYSIQMGMSYAAYIVYANYDIYDLEGNIYLEGDDTSVNYVEVPYYPDALLGDVAPGVADGTLDSESIALPDEIELGGIISSSATALDEITAAQKELLSNPSTYNSYVETITTPVTTPSTSINGGTLANTSVASFLQSIGNLISKPITALGNTILDGIKAIFVPEAGYIQAKIDALTARYAFANSIVDTAIDLKGFLNGLGSQPPIIYIDLGSTEGSYDIGGRTAFIDLTWYGRYKPTMDIIIAAFLWLFFVWRVFIALPGIIEGLPGFDGGAQPVNDKSLVVYRSPGKFLRK